MIEGLNESLIVGIDFTNGKDVAVLLVGRKRPGKVTEIINAFKGEEAIELYNYLTTKQVGVKKDE